MATILVEDAVRQLGDAARDADNDVLSRVIAQSTGVPLPVRREFDESHYAPRLLWPSVDAPLGVVIVYSSLQLHTIFLPFIGEGGKENERGAFGNLATLRSADGRVQRIPPVDAASVALILRPVLKVFADAERALADTPYLALTNALRKEHVAPRDIGGRLYFFSVDLLTYIYMGALTREAASPIAPFFELAERALRRMGDPPTEARRRPHVLLYYLHWCYVLWQAAAFDVDLAGVFERMVNRTNDLLAIQQLIARHILRVYYAGSSEAQIEISTDALARVTRKPPIRAAVVLVQGRTAAGATARRIALNGVLSAWGVVPSQMPTQLMSLEDRDGADDVLLRLWNEHYASERLALAFDAARNLVLNSTQRVVFTYDPARNAIAIGHYALAREYDCVLPLTAPVPDAPPTVPTAELEPMLRQMQLADPRFDAAFYEQLAVLLKDVQRARSAQEAQQVQIDALAQTLRDINSQLDTQTPVPAVADTATELKLELKTPLATRLEKDIVEADARVDRALAERRPRATSMWTLARKHLRSTMRMLRRARVWLETAAAAQAAVHPAPPERARAVVTARGSRRAAKANARTVYAVGLWLIRGAYRVLFAATGGILSGMEAAHAVELVAVHGVAGAVESVGAEAAALLFTKTLVPLYESSVDVRDMADTIYRHVTEELLVPVNGVVHRLRSVVPTASLSVAIWDKAPAATTYAAGLAAMFLPGRATLSALGPHTARWIAEVFETLGEESEFYDLFEEREIEEQLARAASAEEPAGGNAATFAALRNLTMSVGSSVYAMLRIGQLGAWAASLDRGAIVPRRLDTPWIPDAPTVTPPKTYVLVDYDNSFHEAVPTADARLSVVSFKHSDGTVGSVTVNVSELPFDRVHNVPILSGVKVSIAPDGTRRYYVDATPARDVQRAASDAAANAQPSQPQKNQNQNRNTPSTFTRPELTGEQQAKLAEMNSNAQSNILNAFSGNVINVNVVNKFGGMPVGPPRTPTILPVPPNASYFTVVPWTVPIFDASKTQAAVVTRVIDNVVEACGIPKANLPRGEESPPPSPRAPRK